MRADKRCAAGSNQARNQAPLRRRASSRWSERQRTLGTPNTRRKSFDSARIQGRNAFGFGAALHCCAAFSPPKQLLF